MRDDAEYPVGTEISDRQNKTPRTASSTGTPATAGCATSSSPGPAPSRNPNRGQPGPTPPSPPPSRSSPASPACRNCAKGPPWTGLPPVSTSSPSNAAAPAARQARRRLPRQRLPETVRAGHPRRRRLPRPPRHHLGAPRPPLRVHPSSISVPAAIAITVLGKHGITRQPGDPRISTPGKLLEHAAAAGITLTIPDTAPGKDGNRHPEDTRDTPGTVDLKTDAAIAAVDPRSRKRAKKRTANAGKTGGHAGFRLPIARMTHDPGARATPGPQKARDRGATLTQPQRPSAVTIYLGKPSRPRSGTQPTAGLS